MKQAYLYLAILLLLLAVCATGSGCGGASSVSIPIQRSDSLSADGSAREWDALSARYFEEDEVVVGTATNGDDLFIMLRFRRPEYAAQIRAGGLSLSLDPSGGFGKDFTLHYRGAPAAGEGALAPPLQAERRRFRSAAPDDSLMVEELTLAIRGHIEEKPIPVTGEEGPSVAAGFDRGFFVYEFRVPLGESQVRLYRLNMPPDGSVGIALKWGGRLKQDVMSEYAGEGLMGDHIPPGGGPGPGGFAGDANRPQPREHEIRLKVLLGEM